MRDRWDRPPQTFRLSSERSHDTGDADYIRIAITLLLGGYICYRLLLFYDYHVSSPLEACWNALVYIMPSRLAFAIDPADRGRRGSNESSTFTTPSSEHASKSEALRRALRLEKSPKPTKGNLVRSPPGLGNWDNSCYQNSVLQALAASKSLASFLAAELRDSLNDTENNTATTLHSTIERLNTDSGSYFWTPSTLKSMSSWQQQDAQEYFSKVIDAVEKDVVKERKRRTPPTGSLALFNTNMARNATEPLGHPEILNLTERELENAAMDRAGSVRTPPSTSHPLEGLLAQRVGCTRCGYSEGVSLIPFNCLTLPLGRHWQYDISTCLDDYTSLEMIEGVECAKCTLMRNRDQLRQLSKTFRDEKDSNSKPETDGEACQDKGYREQILQRLDAVETALDDEDFAESTLAKTCQIPSRLRVNSTKSRQAVVIRSPQTLVMHLNRSLFDEMTGMQAKNYADIRYPKYLDLGPWSMGGNVKEEDAISADVWEMNPSKSMLRNHDDLKHTPPLQYRLRAVVSHYGRHENGHYYTYAPRRLSSSEDAASTAEDAETWWRFSDEDVSRVNEDEVLSQGGVFMLFYEKLDHNEIRQLADLMTSESALATADAKEAVTLGKYDIDGDFAEERFEEVEETTDSVRAMNFSDTALCADDSVLQPASFSASQDEFTASRAMSVSDDMSSLAETTSNESQDQPAIPTVEIPTMRTAGIEMHQGTDDASRFKSLHMVASM